MERYFPHFECVATTFEWPKAAWTLLLQCVLTGKAQEVYSSLALDQCADYEIVKAAILRAYELVPEAYRQRFRGSRRVDKQTFVEFAREKEILFNRWCASQKAETKEHLRELVLLEEFKNCVPEAVATYLSEQRVARIGDAAVLADEYVLAHKTVFNDNPREAKDHASPRPLRFTAGSDGTGSSGFSTKPASSGSGNSESLFLL